MSGNKAPAERIVAFAVVKVDGAFVPMKLELSARTPCKGTPLHEPSTYEALAYEYLQGDVIEHWRACQIARSIPSKAEAAKEDET